jgi:hypothetical protein
MKRILSLAGVLGAICAVGCGSSQAVRSRTSSTTTRAHASAAAVAARRVSLQKVRKAETCLTADTGYLTLARDMQKVDTSNLSAVSNQQALSQVVADVASYKTALTVLRPAGDPSQQAQLDQYQAMFSQVAQGAQSAAAGDYATAISDWSGAAPQLGQVPTLVTAICAP